MKKIKKRPGYGMKNGKPVKKPVKAKG